MGVPFVKPAWAPALPPDARTLSEPNGSSGAPSVGVLVVLSVVAAILFDRYYYVPTYPEAELDERLVMAAARGAAFALAAAFIHAAQAGPALAARRAGGVRADPAARAHLPRAGHDLPRLGHAHRGRRHGRHRRARDGARAPAPLAQAHAPGDGHHRASSRPSWCSSSSARASSASPSTA